MVKNWPANAGNMGLIPGLERSPGEGNGKVTKQQQKLESNVQFIEKLIIFITMLLQCSGHWIVYS